MDHATRDSIVKILGLSIELSFSIVKK